MWRRGFDGREMCKGHESDGVSKKATNSIFGGGGEQVVVVVDGGSV